jgi:hypothetical protein
MGKYKCDNCEKEFDRKNCYENHINRINPCVKLLNPDNNIKLPENNNSNNNIINAKRMKECLEKCICIYCNKEFTRRDNVIYHIKHSCKKVKEIENEKLQIFNELKRIEEEKEKKKILEEKKFKLLEEENMKIKQETAQLKKVVSKLEKELKKSTKNITTIGSNNKNNKNSNNIITTTNNQQNIVLVGYKKEDMENIDKNEFLAIMKRGYQAPL